MNLVCFVTFYRTAMCYEIYSVTVQPASEAIFSHTVGAAILPSFLLYQTFIYNEDVILYRVYLCKFQMQYHRDEKDE